jgi:hypothetical protein
MYIILGIVLSYLISVIVDYYVTSQNTKIIIAFILGLCSIIILYLVYKFMTDPIICDPVHNPGNQTVCDPVHRNQQNDVNSLIQLKEIQVDVKEVSNSLEACLEKL